MLVVGGFMFTRGEVERHAFIRLVSRNRSSCILDRSGVFASRFE